MTQPIVNAAPMVINRGTEDASRRPLLPQPEVIPTHLPKVYTFAETGPLDPQLVVGDSLLQMYGDTVLDFHSAYATHQTALMSAVNAAGNSMMVERVIPTDAPPPANARLWADVLPALIPQYERNTDGSIKLDGQGVPIPMGDPVAGFKVKWVVTPIALGEDDEDLFGQGTILPGDQTDGQSTQSQRYPIMDFAYPHQGARGNRNGVRIYAPTEVSASPINRAFITNDLVYPFRIQLVEKSTSTGTPIVQATQSASQFIDFCLKPNTTSSVSQAPLYLARNFPAAWQQLDSTSGVPPAYGPIGRFHMYQDNIDTLLEEFYAAEAPLADAFSDFDNTPGEMYRFNLFSGVSSHNSPYHTYQVVTTANNSQRLTENSVFYVSGGGDGTMNETVFAQLVSDRVKEYNNPLSPLLNIAKYPESWMYDSGFPLQTKYDLINFIAIRKDTAVVLTPFDVLGPQLTQDEESSLAIALRTRLQQFPESDYFGTSTMRGVIVGRSGEMIDVPYDKPLPLSIDVASKMADYMGAGNGRWRAGGAFNISPANQVTNFKNVNVTYTPASVRNRDWDNGLIWVEDFSRNAIYYPAFKTVYDDDTSVLTSIFTVAACVELQKVGQRVHREFTGRDNLTQAQLKSRVERRILELVDGKFDGRFVIQPEVYFTADDTARGYSWTLRINLYANNMRTVMTLELRTLRMEDLVTATA